MFWPMFYNSTTPLREDGDACQDAPRATDVSAGDQKEGDEAKERVNTNIPDCPVPSFVALAHRTTIEKESPNTYSPWEKVLECVKAEKEKATKEKVVKVRERTRSVLMDRS